MGLLDRLKKKSTLTETSRSPEIEQTELDDSQSFDDENDLFMESDSEQDLYEFDSLEPDNSDDVTIENQNKTTSNKSTGIIILCLILTVVLLILIGSGVWYYFSNRTYSMLEERSKAFIKALSEFKNNNAHKMMDESLKSKISKDTFNSMRRSSAYYFDQILKIMPDKKSFRFEGDVASLRISVEYNITGILGEFNLKFRRTEDRFLITGFKVSSEKRKDHEEKMSLDTVKKFLKILEDDPSDQFNEYFHKDITDRWEENREGDELIEGLKKSKAEEPSLVEEDKQSNVELTYSVILTTESGTKMDGEITVFYTDTRWHIIKLKFTPQSSKEI